MNERQKGKVAGLKLPVFTCPAQVSPNWQFHYKLEAHAQFAVARTLPLTTKFRLQSTHEIEWLVSENGETRKEKKRKKKNYVGRGNSPYIN
eukprot:1161168-Pelagomonas_calceolata.AAC.4